jgi:hypothetical protein
MEKFRQPTTLLARRAEMGQHHRISGKYLYQYAPPARQHRCMTLLGLSDRALIDGAPDRRSEAPS